MKRGFSFKAVRLAEWLGKWILPSFISAVFAFLCLPSLQAQTSAYGKPAGFVRIQVPANGQTMSSIPFTPFDSSLNSVFDKQLTGEATPASADKIQKWDAASQAYVSAFKADQTGDSAKNGKWFYVNVQSEWVSSPLTIAPGDPFWIQNLHSSGQSVFLMGKLVLDGSRQMTLKHGDNTLSYPFSSKLSLNGSDLKNDGAHGSSTINGGSDVFSTTNSDGSVLASYWLLDDPQSADNGKWLDENSVIANVSLSLGKGCWYARGLSGEFTWTEPRPYQNPFNVTVSAPTISGMSLDATLSKMNLAISCTGEPGETLEIFYKDLSATDSLTTESGWLLAVDSLSTDGETSVTWTDEGEGSRQAPNLAFMRIYMVSRKDIDSDGDGLSDGRETFFYGTSWNSVDSDGDGLGDYQELTVYNTNPNSKDSDADGYDDALELKYASDPNLSSSVPSDNSAPTAPGSLSVAASSSTIVALSWAASTDNVEVSAYKVFRNGLEIGRTKSCSYADFNLCPDTQYEYHVVAVDPMGNVSAESSHLTPSTGYSSASCLYVDCVAGSDSANGSSGYPKRSIQSAIDLAADGTVIVVSDGMYQESLTIDSKRVTLLSVSGASKTAIKGVSGRSAVSFKNSSGGSSLGVSILEGFLVYGGSPSGDGGGISIDSCSPVVGNCIVMGNEAANGGGVSIVGAGAAPNATAPALLNCQISSNEATGSGGGIYYLHGRPRIASCTISGNNADGPGGGIYGGD